MVKLARFGSVAVVGLVFAAAIDFRVLSTQASGVSAAALDAMSNALMGWTLALGLAVGVIWMLHDAGRRRR